MTDKEYKRALIRLSILLKAVDGYIHCFPTATEFNLVYSKGFFGIDVFEDAINIRYPSED